MKFKAFTENNIEYPILISTFKNINKEDVKLWVSQKTNSSELFLETEGNIELSIGVLDSFIKGVKEAKKYIMKRK